jgi:RNA-binding protein 39
VRSTNGLGRKRSGSGGHSASGRKRKHRGTYKDRDRRRYHHHSRRSKSYTSDSYSGSSSSSSSSEDEKDHANGEDSTFSKDQRTVFVSQLVMRATESDIRRYFKKKVGCKVKEVILLRDKRTGSHKGYAYIQMGRIEDVKKAVGVAGQPPDFQRFPILVKASESEKNYVIPASSSVVTALMMGTTGTSSPMLSKEGKMLESQKVYVGGLDPSVSEEHIFALFSQFGQLEKVSMQMDPSTNSSRGYAFLSFRDPKEANLAIQTMSNQVLAGRPMKTGWANQTSSVPGVEVVTSEGFPENANVRAQKSLAVLAQLMGSSETSVAANAAFSTATTSSAAEKALDAAMGVPRSEAKAQTFSATPTVAEARANLVAEQAAVAQAANIQTQLLTHVTEQAKIIGGQDKPTKNILVHNMFDKDTEEGADWPKEVKEEFEEECTKFGKINSVTVMSEEPGGKIYASFDTVEAASSCATNLAGRWFDKRQLRVDFLEESEMPKEE